MKNVEILNKMWKAEDLILIASTKVVKDLIAKYKAYPNCRAYDWIAGEKISHIEKASFIYSCLF
jgi:hypothetical protein